MLFEKKLEAQKRQRNTGFLSVDSIVSAAHVQNIVNIIYKTHANEPKIPQNKHV